MAAGPIAPSHPPNFPKQSNDVIPPAIVDIKDQEKSKSSPVEETSTKKGLGLGKSEYVTAVPRSLSLHVPRPRSGDELAVPRSLSPVRQGPPLRLRSGNFSLPVRYKYVVIPGNNSRVVLAAFRRRSWWGPARKEENQADPVVVRSVQDRKKSSKTTPSNTGKVSGYSNGAFNLWWEMYVSRPLIEATNTDSKVRQAVNHFEFNATLVSKKGLHQSLRAYCASDDTPDQASIVPETFYLVGGAVQPQSIDADERNEFLAFCVAMDAKSSASSTKRELGNAPVHVQPCTKVAAPILPPPIMSSFPNDADEVSQVRDENRYTQNQTVIVPRLESPPRRADTTERAREEGLFFCSDGSVRKPCDHPSAQVTQLVQSGLVLLKLGTPTIASGVETQDGGTGESHAYHRETREESGNSFADYGTGSGGAERVTYPNFELGGTVGGMPTWVVKPAANSNCGFGIQICCSMKEVLNVVDATGSKAGRSGWVVQRYIERPLLVRGRKFDIRLFVLLVADPSTRSWRRRSKASKSNKSGDISVTTVVNGQSAKPERVKSAGGPPVVSGKPGRGAAGGVGPCPLTAWCHQDAYVRTSSVKYSSDPKKAKDKFVHLTNNAVQRRSPSYGHDEPGNKLSLTDLQAWLDGDGSNHRGKAKEWVDTKLRPRMHALVATSVAAAAAAGINGRGRSHAFELLGYDFMVDDDLRVWLIEVNSNPCLEFVCPLLKGMIVRVIDDTLSVALDPVFRPPEKHRVPKKCGFLGNSGRETWRGGFSRVYPVVE